MKHNAEEPDYRSMKVWRASFIGAFNDNRLPVISFDSMQENACRWPLKIKDFIKRKVVVISKH